MLYSVHFIKSHNYNIKLRKTFKQLIPVARKSSDTFCYNINMYNYVCQLFSTVVANILHTCINILNLER